MFRVSLLLTLASFALGVSFKARALSRVRAGWEEVSAAAQKPAPVGALASKANKTELKPLATDDSLADFPKEPPVQLVQPTSVITRPTLGGRLRTSVLRGMRVRRNITSATGHEHTVSTASGWQLYSTAGELFSGHMHTEMTDAGTGEKLAYIWKWTVSSEVGKELPDDRRTDTYEVDTFKPVCPGKPGERSNEGGGYHFARLTKDLLAFYTYWTVEGYNCNGTWTPLLRVQSRKDASMKYQLDVLEVAGSSDPVGTVDQTYVVSMAMYYDLFAAPDSDEALMAAIAIVVDMDALAKQRTHGEGKV